MEENNQLILKGHQLNNLSNHHLHYKCYYFKLQGLC